VCLSISVFVCMRVCLLSASHCLCPAVIYGIIKGAAAVARKIVASRT
jgi:hypothetical protein